MTKIYLSGFNKDRNLSIVARLLANRNLELTEGSFFGWSTFTFSGNLPQEAIDAISNHFAPMSIEEAREKAYEYIQKWRGDQRDAFGLSDAKWQELTYSGKAAYCRLWLDQRDSALAKLSDQNDIDLEKARFDDGFTMSAEALARGMTPLELANLIKNQNELWLKGNDLIEAQYVSITNAISTETDVEVIEGLIAPFI